MCTRGGLVTKARLTFEVGAQNRLPEAARSAVNQQEHAVGSKPAPLQVGGINDFVDLLQLGEVVSSAKRAQRVVEAGGGQAFAGEEIGEVALPWLFQIEGQLRPSIELHFSGGNVRLPKRHAAADVRSDHLRMDRAVGDEDRAHRMSLAGVQVRQANRQLYSVQARSSVKLADRF